MAKKKKKVDSKKTEKNFKKQSFLSKEWDNRTLLLLTILLAIGYYIYGLFSDGFYQYDEAAHYMSMRAFWHDPNRILGNWAKPGYKLIMVVPALLGPAFVSFVHALVASFTAYFSYKVAELKKLEFKKMVFVFVATQPLWIQLAFRNYSEIPTAFLAILALYLFFKEKYSYTALILSYLCLLRQEFIVISGVFSLWMLYRKQWKPAIIILIFPLLNNIWGWLVTDDPFYLYSMTTGTASSYKNAYPRQGFDHYFKMLPTIIGPITVLGLIWGLYEIIKEKKWSWFSVIIPALIYFMIHVLFNWKTIQIGASTGGNLRYISVIGPYLVLISALGFERAFKAIKIELPILISGGLFALLVAVYMSFEHNNIVFLTSRDWTPFLFVALAIIIWLVFRKNPQVQWILIVAQLVFILVSVRPYPKNQEDATMEKVVDWVKMSKIIDDRTSVANHTLFYYYLGMVPEDFNRKNFNQVTQETIDAAPVGSIIFWDSHYSYRPKKRPTSLPFDYFTKRPEEYKLLKQFITNDQRFGVLVFEKLK